MAQEDERHLYVLDQMKASGLPQIQIGAMEGKLLQFLVRSCHAKKMVEIGTLGGYSALWIADAEGKRTAPGSVVPVGYGGQEEVATDIENSVSRRHLYTLELDPGYAAVAEASFRKVGIADRVTVVVGDAQSTLKTITPFGPFDFCFIDADKVSYPDYLLWASRHLRKGGIVAADNAYLFGKVHLNAETAAPEDAPAILAMQEFIKILTDPAYFTDYAMIPTGEGLAVGIK